MKSTYMVHKLLKYAIQKLLTCITIWENAKSPFFTVFMRITKEFSFSDFLQADKYYFYIGTVQKV